MTTAVALAVDQTRAGPTQHPGVLMTREWAAEAWDPKRDAFSQQVRLNAWDKLESQHQHRKQLIGAG